MRSKSISFVEASSHSPAKPAPSRPAASQASAPYCLSPVQRAMKRSMDIVGVLCFFVLLAPIYLLVAAAVFFGAGGPVHYWQPRLGLKGRSFRFYKFRSMVRDADKVLAQHLERDPLARQQWETFQKLDNDPRITPVGRILRKLSLDELPQFFNVLKGDMSLVGPRPCMVRQRSLYGTDWPHYCQMRPGITGLWQVSGRNRLSYAERVQLDVRYATEWSLWLDLKILARTVRVVLSGDGSS